LYHATLVAGSDQTLGNVMSIMTATIKYYHNPVGYLTPLHENLVVEIPSSLSRTLFSTASKHKLNLPINNEITLLMGAIQPTQFGIRISKSFRW
jgi:hypothetical protein